MTIILGRVPRTDDELYEVVKTLWGHTIPRHKVCPEHNAPFEAFAHGYFNRAPQILIKGSRGLSGKSRLVSLLGLTYAAVYGADTNIVGGSLNQSVNIQETIRDAFNYENAPRYMIRDESQTAVRLKNGAVIRPLTASQKTVRGPHPPMLLLDEIDEMDPEILESAKGQPMPQKNWHGVDHPGPDDHVLDPAVLGQGDGPGADPVPGGGAADLRVVLQGHLEPDRRLAGPLRSWSRSGVRSPPSGGGWSTTWASPRSATVRSTPMRWRRCSRCPPTPSRRRRARSGRSTGSRTRSTDAEYVIGADWAQSVDWTVITVADVTRFPVKVVHWVRMRRHPYPVMIGVFNKLMQAYNAEGIHDATGLGAVVADYIDRRARGFIMAGRVRDDMLSEYVSSIENGSGRLRRSASSTWRTCTAPPSSCSTGARSSTCPTRCARWRWSGGRSPSVRIPAQPMVIAGSMDPTWIEREMRENATPSASPATGGRRGGEQVAGGS